MRLVRDLAYTRGSTTPPTRMTSHPEPREPSLPEALVPVALLMGLLALSVYLFGGDSSTGPNHVALILSAAAASTIGLRDGHRWILQTFQPSRLKAPIPERSSEVPQPRSSRTVVRSHTSWPSFPNDLHSV